SPAASSDAGTTPWSATATSTARRSERFRPGGPLSQEVRPARDDELRPAIRALSEAGFGPHVGRLVTWPWEHDAGTVIVATGRLRRTVGAGQRRTARTGAPRRGARRDPGPGRPHPAGRERARHRRPAAVGLPPGQPRRADAAGPCGRLASRTAFRDVQPVLGLRDS